LREDDSLPLRQLFATFFIAAGLTYLLTPLVRRIALRWKLGDRPNGRKIHGSAIPHLGGIALFLGVLAALYFAVLGHMRNEPDTYAFLAAFLPAGGVLVLLGLVDDLATLNPRQKMIVQSFSACLVPILGITFPLDAFFGDRLILGYVVSFLLTYFWFVGASCAYNLIDGMDGLAAGLVAISSAAFALGAWLAGALLPLFIALALLGATLAFLRHNFYPARIFMGDTGSLFLGFVLAFIAVLLAMAGRTTDVFLGSLLILAVPILDTLLAIVRRIATRRPVFLPDADHIHHKLLAMGYSQPRVAFLLFGTQALFAAFGVLVLRGHHVFLYCAIAAAVAFFVFGLILMVRPSPERRRATLFEGAPGAPLPSLERRD
jgi:UDP-GlcNAc:undecaprenyl-phosphate GlcNAc-1-phosphate transferase